MFAFTYLELLFKSTYFPGQYDYFVAIKVNGMARQ